MLQRSSGVAWMLPALLCAAACGGGGEDARSDAPAGDAGAAQAASEEGLAALQAALEEEARAHLLAVDAALMALDELGALVDRRASPKERGMRAERILARLDPHAAALTATPANMRLWIAARGRAAALLARPDVGRHERANAIADEMVAAAAALADRFAEERAAAAAYGEAFVAKGRVEAAEGRQRDAVGSFERGVEILLAADKGRGTGGGSTDFRGEGEGDGRGRGRGQGKNKAESIALKRHAAAVLAELAELYDELGDRNGVDESIVRERHLHGNLCKVLTESPDYGLQLARLDMADVIDRVADAYAAHGDLEGAITHERLAQQIIREILEQTPNDRRFAQRLVPQGLELAERLAERGQSGDLRAAVTQSFEDLKLLENLGFPEAERKGLEARLCLAMARGLAAVPGPLASQEEVANWYARSLEAFEAARLASGGLTVELAAAEDVALAEYERLSGGG